MNFFTLILFLFLNRSLNCLKNINDRDDHGNLKYLKDVFSHEHSDKFIVKYTEETLHKLYNKLEISSIEFYENMTNINDKKYIEEMFNKINNHTESVYKLLENMTIGKIKKHTEEVSDKLYNKLEISSIKFYENMTNINNQKYVQEIFNKINNYTEAAFKFYENKTNINDRKYIENIFNKINNYTETSFKLLENMKIGRIKKIEN